MKFLNHFNVILKHFLLGSIIIGQFTYLYGQEAISSQQWKQDLKHLQEIVHADYPFLFKKISQSDWDDMVEELYEQIPDMESHEIVVGFARIVSAFKYGHTSVHMGSVLNLHYLPLYFYQFKDDVYVQGIVEEYADLVGSKLIAVEGVPTSKAMEMIRPVFPEENEQFFKAYGLRYLIMPEVLHAQGITETMQKEITLTLEKDGKSMDKTFKAIEKLDNPSTYGFVLNQDQWVSARKEGELPIYLQDLDKIYSYKYIPEHKLLYVRQSQIQDDPSEDIPTFYARVFEFIDNNEVEKLVLDVRLNGGGNNYKNKPVITGIIQSEKINQIGNFFTIIGRRTFSACQNLVNELDNYTNVIFVGEPTGENINFYGDVNQINLPHSKLGLRLSFAWWQDKPQWENEPWMAPHIAVETSFQEFVENKDPVLEAILQFDSEGFIKDPMSHFTNLFLAGKIDQLKEDAVNMVNDPKYSFFDFEGEFNDTGYTLLGRNQIQEALFVFQMVTQLFPESANAWDSLAEGHWKAGDLDNARKYYKKAIEMDPDGRIGANARSNLKKIEHGEKH